MRTLYGIGMSPWTERARWALEHHRVAYAFHEHVPMLGEPLLRRVARKASGSTKRGPATVPLLVDGDVVIMTSTAIARHAEGIGSGAPLFRAGPDDAEVARWDALSQRVAEVGRAWLLRNLARDHEAQRESLPAFIPGPIRGLAASSVVLAGAFLRKKYGIAVGPEVEANVDGVVRPALAEVRSALGGRATLLEAFSWADVCVATALQVLRPHARASMGPRAAAAWANEELAREFDDLLVWRDALVAAHR
jgi:glutathione S-transferase